MKEGNLMNSLKKFVSLFLSVLMVASVFVGTTAFAAITDPSLWYGEDFDSLTAGGAYTTPSDDKLRFTNTGSAVLSQDEGDSNIYLKLLKNDVRFGQPNSGVLPNYITGRGGSNCFILEFDFRLPTLGTAENYPAMQFRYGAGASSGSSWNHISFIGAQALWGSSKGSGNAVSGLTVEANKWMHLTFMNSGNGLRIYIDGVQVASTTTTTYVGWAIYLNNADKCNFHIDNLKAYAFTNGDVTAAVAEAGKWNVKRDTTSRLDAAVDILIQKENTAVSTSATATADYTNEIAKINTIIEQYKKAATYESYKDDATVGSEVTALLAAVDDTTKTDAEITALFDAVDAKLEVVAFIDEIEQYIEDNAPTKDTANLSYLLAIYNSEKSDSALAQLSKAYDLYKAPSADMLYLKKFSYDFSEANMSNSKASAYTGNSLDTANQNYAMATNDSGLAWHSRNALGTSTHLSSGVVTTSATLNFSSNTAKYPKAIMICSGEQNANNRDVALIGLAAREDGHFYLYLDNNLDNAIKLGAYQANTPYDVKLVADLDNKVGEVYINGVKQATDGPVLLGSSTAYYVFSSRAGDATFTIDNVSVNIDIMKNKIAFSDKDEVVSDITLPTETTDGYPIRWSTNNASVVAADGKVNVPSSGSAVAVLTADVLCGEKTASYSYVINVGNTRTLYRSHRLAVLGNNVTMNVNLANVTNASKDAISYLVVIDESTNKIVDIDVAEAVKTVAAGANGYLTNTVTIPTGEGSYSIRGFVWDSKLIPLANIAAINESALR